jgi:ADP-ribose pyrophosphatase YjhB (NUDIX family)
MNYNNNIDNCTNEINDFINEKIIISNKNYYCSNCNKRGHTYKKCYEPIISNGIISLYIDDFDNSLIPSLENYIIKNIKKNNKYINNLTTNFFYKKVKFLMVQRKHSLGYMEFLRGHYDIESIEGMNGIKYLLKQMTPIEIKEINIRDFDYLWNMLWDNNPNSTTTIKNKHHYKEYITSKQKFYELKMNKNNILSTAIPTFNFNEWGFPKGRREIYETDLVCAMREFEEETNYKENEYSILDESNIIRENLVGTNGINYRHNYFLAIVHKKQINNGENKEIGDINFMDIDKCMDVIRPYHHNKQIIIKKIHNLIVNFLIENSNNVQ